MKNPPFPLVKLPSHMDLTLYLIREDLKSEKFFNGLHKIGIEECPYQPRLGKAVLANMGLDDGTDATFEFYYRLIEKRSKKLKGDHESLMKQVMKVYVALCEEKERRKRV